MESRFRKIFTELRASITDQEKVHYFLHTNVGLLRVGSLNYCVDGYIFVTGEDENKAYRLIGFSEQQIATFPIEVKQRSSTAKAVMGFTASPASEDVFK